MPSTPLGAAVAMAKAIAKAMAKAMARANFLPEYTLLARFVLQLLLADRSWRISPCNCLWRVSFFGNWSSWDSFGDSSWRDDEAHITSALAHAIDVNRAILSVGGGEL